MELSDGRLAANENADSREVCRCRRVIKMAIKKLKLSKSLAARTAAIFVLVGMGGFAVWQSKSRQEETGGQDKEQTLVAAADSESSEVSQDAQTRPAVPSTSQEQNLEVRTPPPLPVPSTFKAEAEETGTLVAGANPRPPSKPSSFRPAEGSRDQNAVDLLMRNDSEKEDSSEASGEDGSGDSNGRSTELGGFKPPGALPISSGLATPKPSEISASRDSQKPPSIPASGGTFGGGSPPASNDVTAASSVLTEGDKETTQAAPSLLTNSEVDSSTGSTAKLPGGGFRPPTQIIGNTQTETRQKQSLNRDSLDGDTREFSPEDTTEDRSASPTFGGLSTPVDPKPRPLTGGLGRPAINPENTIESGGSNSQEFRPGTVATPGQSFPNQRGETTGIASNGNRANSSASTSPGFRGNPKPLLSGDKSESGSSSMLSSQGEATGLPVEPRGTTDLTPRPTARPTDIGPPASLGIPQGASPRGPSSGSGGSVSGQTKIPSPNVPKPGGNAFSRPRDNGPASSGVANQNTPPLNSTPLGYPAGYRDPTADRDSIDNSRSNFGANASEPNFQHPDHTLGLPGDAALEGLQTPALVIEKRAPAQVQLGKTTLIQLIVKNVGGTKASDVKVVDRVPRGSKYVSAKPKPSMSGDQLTWDLGDVQPGDEVVIETSLVAEKTGELGSVAQVSFSSIATTRTLVTEPKLTITQSAAKFVMIDDEINLQIRIENVGTGAAENVTVETDISEQVAHPVGSELRYEVGRLEPGDYQDLTLTLNAKKPGKIQQRILVQGDGTEVVEEVTNFEIIAPELDLQVKGPSLRYLDRKAIHKIALDNLGTADATNVELVAVLSPGLQFISADRNGSYDVRTHAVYWSLESLPKGDGDTVRLTTIPTQIGEASIDYRLRSELVSEIVDRQKMEVRELAELFFEIDDEVDPIEIGSETIYRVTVTNQGSKDATNVKMRMIFPKGILVTDDIESPVDYKQTSGTITFNDVERIAPDQKIEIVVRAEGTKAGDQRVAFELSSDERPDWVRKEESTRVYSDQ